MAKNAPTAAVKTVQQPAVPAELFRNSAIPYVAIALALAGVVLGFILTRNYFQHTVVGAATGCAINAYVDCDRISSSAFAAIGRVPISAFGLGMHAAVLAALVVAHFSTRVRQGLIGGSAVLALAATVVSVVLAVVSFFVIRALCLYCTALQLVNLALAGTLVFGLAGGAERLKRAVRSVAGPAIGPGVMAGCIGIVVAVAAPWGLSSGAEQKLLEQQIFEARDSQRLADRYLRFRSFDFQVSDSPQLGDPNAPITLVVYADYNCPYCHEFDPKIIEVANDFADVRLVYKFYPLDGTCNRSMPRTSRSSSCAAAAAAYSAYQEGKFWEYNDTLFANFQRYGPNRLVDYARQVGLSDPEIARTALEDRTVRAKIEADIAEADRAGLTGTPTLFFNGRQFLRSRVPPNRDEISIIRSLIAEARGG